VVEEVQTHEKQRYVIYVRCSRALIRLQKPMKGEFKPVFLEEEIPATPVVATIRYTSPIFVETAAELASPVTADVIGASKAVPDLDTHFQLTPELANVDYDLSFDKKNVRVDDDFAFLCLDVVSQLSSLF